MEISDQAMQLLRDGGLTIEIEAVVLSARTFKAAGKDVAKVTVVGTKGGPMGNNIQCSPYGIFELDADVSVFHDLAGLLTEPVRAKFKADLKPINEHGSYVVHLLEVIG